MAEVTTGSVPQEVLWLAAAAVASVVWMGLALGSLHAKLGAPRWKAWLPVTRWIPVARAGHVSGGLVIAARATALVAGLVAVAAWVAIDTSTGLIRDAGLSDDAVRAALAGGAFVWAAGTVTGWVLWILGAGYVQLRMRAPRGLTWVAALAPWLWAAIMGWGPYAARRGAIAPERTAPERTAPDPTASESSALESSTSPPEGAADADAPDATPPSAASPEPVESSALPVRASSLSSPAAPEESPAPAALSPLPPPSAPTPEPEPAEDLATRPLSVLPPPSATSEPDAEAPRATRLSPYIASLVGKDEVSEDPLEEPTIVVPRQRAAWRLVLESGEYYDLASDVVVVGRATGTRFEVDEGEDAVLRIVDATRTMSKTHARLRRDEDGWWVTDLGSTNGTYVRTDDGEVEATDESRIIGALVLGDLVAAIERTEDVS